MIDNQLENLQSLREYLQQESCQPQEPFIKLGQGNAPEIDYNLPESVSFSTYGDMPVNIDRECFKESCNNAPRNNYFSVVATAIRTNTLNQKLRESIQLQHTHTAMVANVNSFREHLDMSRTDFEAVANQDDSLTAKITAKDTYLNDVQLAKFAQEGTMPVFVDKLNKFGNRVEILKEPATPHPCIFVIEEYKTSTYLGNYGAGRTIQTFSLLPGEKTTLTIRTYKDSTSMKSHSENLLDSVSQSSIDELESLIEEESGTETINSETKTHDVKVGVSVSAKVCKMVNVAGSVGYGYNHSKTASRTANTRALNRALEHHVAQSNSSRNIEINTSTSETVNEGEEYTTVREIQNINKSRVLNFVFRQLLQEYVSITYLSNIRIAYTNGYMESVKIVDLEDLDELLEEVIVEAQRTSVKAQILKDYCYVLNHEGEPVEFIVENEVDVSTPFGDVSETFWSRSKMNDSYRLGDREIDIPGVILQVEKNILRTPSVVVDALLGQGEALDCFNIKAQDAIAVGENLKNLEMLQKLEIMEGITTAEDKAELYKKVFGECCGCPQTQIING
jgi:hypothetical protein